VIHLDRIQKISRTGRMRCRREKLIVSEIPDPEERRGSNGVAIVYVVGTGGREITLIGVIRSFFIFDVADELRHQPIDVGITLTVRLRRYVD